MAKDSIAQLVTDLLDNGIYLYVADGELRFKAPKGALTKPQRDAVVANKAAIIAYLTELKARETLSSKALPSKALPEQRKDSREMPNIVPRASVSPSKENSSQNEHWPLSFAQQRLWFVDQLGGGSAQYNTQGMLFLTGAFHKPAFEQAVTALIQRHEILRTVYASSGAADPETGSGSGTGSGTGTQRISPNPALPVSYRDFSNLAPEQKQQQMNALLSEEAKQHFDLSCDVMVRLKLVHIDGQNQAAVFTLHHIACDGWSVTLFKRELQALYQAFANGQPNPLEPLNIQYADFALWQRQWLNSDNLNQQKTFWLNYLKGIPLKHSLPLDKPRPAKQSHDGLLLQQPINRELTAKIRAVCEQEGVTLFMLLQTLFALVLGRYSFSQNKNQQENDIVMGTAVAGRLHQDVEPLIGLFLNMLVLRTNVSPGQTLRGLLQHNRDAILQAYQHQSMPFEKLVEELAPERDLSHNALIQILFGVQNNEQDLPASSSQASASSTSQNDDRIPLSTRFDLKLDVYEIGDELLCGWLYNTSLFADSSITRLSQSFEVLVNHACEQLLGSSKGNIDIAHLQVLANSAETPAATEPRTFPLVHSLFEHWAENQPDAVAIIDEFSNNAESELSFAELNTRANQLAHYLIEQGLISEPEQRIALCLSRSANMIVAMLGIMKAGGCYVPLDPEYPDARLQYVLQDSGAKVVLTESALASRFNAASNTHCLLLDNNDLQQRIQNQSNTNPAKSALSSANLMYMIYTSGSTGKPKGVLVTHNNVSEFVQQGITDFLPEHIDGAVVSSSLVFDATVGSLWVALCAGRFIELLPEGAMALEQLGDYLADEDSNYLFKVTPSHLDAVAGSGYFASANGGTKTTSNARHVIVVAGEALQMQSLQHWAEQLLPHSLIINEYGPTETTVGATIFPYIADTTALPQIGSAPIGHALGDTQLYVLNDAMQEQVNGGVGELYIGGTGVTRGYAGKAALTASRFVPNPFAKSTSTEGSRLYRTGDKVRWLFNSDNQRTALQFLGRIDEQIKLRGYRIETGEIEAMLLQQSGVNDAFVMLSQVENESETGTNSQTITKTQLLAYVVVDQHHGNKQRKESTQNSQIIKQLQQGLAQTLPAYMLPSHILLLDNLPLNVNGKVDRHQLPQPNVDGVTRIGGQYVAPRNILEQQLCELWAELLNISLAENTNTEPTNTKNQPTAVGIEDNFFALGGHSLLATRLVSVIRERFNTELPLGILFESPTIAGLSSYMSQHLSENASTSTNANTTTKQSPEQNQQQTILPDPSTALADRRLPLPLSFAQQRLWFLDQFEQGSSHYHMPGIVALDLPFHAQSWQHTITALLQRHEILRTRIRVHKSDKDQEQEQATQHITAEFSQQALQELSQVIDLSQQSEPSQQQQINAEIASSNQQGFDLTNDFPIRLRAFVLSEQQFMVHYLMHHIASDGWSLAILRRELAALYQDFYQTQNEPAASALSLPALPLQYADYANWQQQCWQQGLYADSLNYWQQQLASIPVVHNVPLDKPRPNQRRFNGKLYQTQLSDELVNQLQACGRSHNVTLFMIMQTALAVLLQRYSGSDDILIGSSIAGRTHQSLENLIGFFINNIVIRHSFHQPNAGFAALLQQNKQTILHAYQHQHVPFEMLVEKLNPQRSTAFNPVFQIKLDVANHSQPLLVASASDAHFHSHTQVHSVKEDLYINVQESRSESENERRSEYKNSQTHVNLFWRYDADLFNPDTIERMAQHFQNLLSLCLQQPECPVNELNFLTREEQQQLQAFGTGLTPASLPDPASNPAAQVQPARSADRGQPARSADRGQLAHSADKGQIAHLAAQFEAQVERTPDAIAVSQLALSNQNNQNNRAESIELQSSISYAQLNAQANQLAHYLLAKGTQPNQVVALRLNRSPMMIAAILGVLKAGAAILPLDIRLPEQRIVQILRDALQHNNAPILISETALLKTNTFKSEQVRRDVAQQVGDLHILALDDFMQSHINDNHQAYSSDNPSLSQSLSPSLYQPEHLAWVIYTSGSTGVPKGVMVEHRAVSTYCQHARHSYYADSANLAGAMVATAYSFDLTAPGLYLPLFTGGNVLLMPEGTELDALCAQLQTTTKPYLLRLTPSHISALLSLFTGNKVIATTAHAFVLGGEALRQDLVNALQSRFPNARIYNHYGPSEAVIGCVMSSPITTSHSDSASNPPAENRLCAIGKPLSHVQVKVLNPAGCPVPVGVAGELYVSGSALARGYLNQPSLTDERFVHAPASSELTNNTTRWYRTGDSVYWQADGQLMFAGRTDTQLKLRGMRIEPGDIEHALRKLTLNFTLNTEQNQHITITDAVVNLREINHSPALVAYVVLGQFTSQDQLPIQIQEPVQEQIQGQIKHQLSKQLPDYMVPAAIVIVDAMPLTAHGKIAQQQLAALPLPESTPETAPQTAPKTALESTLCAIWAQVLQREQVGIHDDFFALGGHSLLATRLINQVRAQCSAHVPLRAVFEAPTVHAMAEKLASEFDVSDSAAFSLSHAHENPLSQTPAMPDIAPVSRDQALPLSFAQQRLWFIDQLGQGSLEYNTKGSLLFATSDSFNTRAFEQALQALINRHEVLRSHFVSTAMSEAENETANKPQNSPGSPALSALSDQAEQVQQVIKTQFDLPLTHHDFSQYSASEQTQHMAQLQQQEAQTPFNLASDLMLRVHLVKLSEHLHWVFYGMHHIASDGWSRGIVSRELKTLYHHFCTVDSSEHTVPLAPLPIQYADYAAWQRQYLQGDVLQQQLDYWQQRLQGMPLKHSLPLDKPRPARQTHQGNLHEQRLSPELSQRIQRVCQQEGFTLFMLLQPLFAVLLSRYSQNHDIIMGTPVAGRLHRDTEGLIGFFVNTLVLRTDVSAGQSLREFLLTQRDKLLSDFEHQAIPFERLVESISPQRDLSHNALVQILFGVQNNEQESLLDGDFSEFTSTNEQSKNQEGQQQDQSQNQNSISTRFDLKLDVYEPNNKNDTPTQASHKGLRLGWIFNIALFSPHSIARMAQSFEQLLSHAVDVLESAYSTDTGKNSSDIALEQLSVAEQIKAPRQEPDQALNKDQKDYPLVHALFEHWATTTPDAIAIRAIRTHESTENSPLISAHTKNGSDWSYARLNQRAEQIAALLQQHGVQPEHRVALYMRRSPDMIAAMLGIMKAGGCYVPVDPDYPDARLNFVLNDSGTTLILTESHLAQRINALAEESLSGSNADKSKRTFNPTAILLDQPFSAPKQLVKPALTAANLMYMIYTSGSTGIPKGVLVSHGNVSEFVQQGIADFLPEHIQGAVVSSPLVFDATVGSLWVALCAGRSIDLVPEGAEALRYLGEYLCSTEQHYLFKITPSHLEALAAEPEFTSRLNLNKSQNENTARHVLVVAGEALHSQSLQQWANTLLPNSTFINEYGPTETTVGATTFTYQPHASLPLTGSAPIGDALGDTQLYVLNDALQAQVPGGAGELYIGGAGVTRGYLNRGGLTASRFVPNPFSHEPGARLYRTGDVVRWLFADSNTTDSNSTASGLQFLSRVDDQIKLRGYRIETGEIEAMLLQHPQVNDASVVIHQANESKNNSAQIVAYVVSQERIKEPLIQEPEQEQAPESDSAFAETCLQWLSSQLPAYMVPALFIPLPYLPLNVNGKVDKAALPNPSDYLANTQAFVPPENDTQQQLCAMWQTLLSLEQVSITSNFFSIGGHSLLATRMVSMIRAQFSVELALRTLFEQPTIKQLAEHILDQQFYKQSQENEAQLNMSDDIEEVILE